MAVTITTGLPDDFAAFAPVIIEGTTDRWPFTGMVRQSETIIDIEEDDGKLGLRMAGNIATFKEDDTILLEGATNQFAQYNGRHKAAAATYYAGPNQTVLQTQTDWVAATTGDTGTAYRMNDNLFIRLNIANDTDSEALGELYARVANGAFSADVSKPIQQAFSSQFTLATGNQATAAAHGSKEIEITFDEVFTAADYSLTIATGAATPEEGIGHMSADITGMLNPATVAASRVPFDEYRIAPGGKIIYRGFCDPAEIDARLEIWFKPSPGTTTDVVTTIVNKNFVAVYQVPATAKSVTVQTQNYDGMAWYGIRKDVFIKVANTQTGKRLHFLNHLGGWHVMEVHKFEDRTVSTKIDKWTVETYTERTLYGIEEHRETGLYLADLVDSPEIRDETGELVEVLDSELLYRAELIQPVVRLKLEKNHIT
jgi:hypothetical protein